MTRQPLASPPSPCLRQATRLRGRRCASAFVRTGEEAELKSISAGSNPDGGSTVLPQMAHSINSKVFDRSPLGRLARRVMIDSGNAWQEPFDTDDIEAAWVAAFRFSSLWRGSFGGRVFFVWRRDSRMADERRAAC